jgi:hypothetical protein
VEDGFDEGKLILDNIKDKVHGKESSDNSYKKALQ